MEEQKATKVTLYLPPDLHRQLKIRSAVEGEAMSSIAKRALDFYLAHSEVVEENLTPHRPSHQIYDCPSCATPVVLHQGDLVEVAKLSRSVPRASSLDSTEVAGMIVEPTQFDEGELVVC